MDALQLLKDSGVLTAEDAAALKAEQSASGTAIEALLEKRGISEEQLLKALAAAHALPYRIIPEAGVEEQVLKYVPEESARHYQFVPLSVGEGALEIGIVDPDNIEALDALQFISTRVGMPYKLFLVSRQGFDRVAKQYENLSGEVGEALSEFDGGEAKAEETGKPAASQSVEEQVIKADAPVTKIVATILRYAVEGGASDIHIEPTVEKTKVRFRMDGDLHTSLELPNKVHQAVVARIKILSQIRLDEKRKPQDGRFSATVEGRRIDFRVSTFPTEHGEKVVMRILDRARSVTTLETVGFSETDLAMVRELIKAPYGIILIAGPTGSGKSTTLFAMLSELDRETQNVVSIEDPVEYEIDGVAQSQVKPEIGYTFASGLRSILRQDPDVIMVGEIRDKETAQLAIQAALTGHLVFSTIHTNTAAGVIPRLVDMGVDPYLIAPTLIAAISQRLVRRMCPGAGVPVPITDSIKGFLEEEFASLPPESRKQVPPFDHLYRAQATPDCPAGTRGRMAVFEFLRMDKDLEAVVLATPVEEKVSELARQKGMLTMRQDAIMKALAGQIPFEEVNSLGGQMLAEEEEPEDAPL
jgi:type IV pilus assembly protein PilB